MQHVFLGRHQRIVISLTSRVNHSARAGAGVVLAQLMDIVSQITDVCGDFVMTESR